MKQIIPILFLMIFVVKSSFSDHIVGGEMTYKCLGNDKYKIELTLYKHHYHFSRNANKISCWFERSYFFRFSEFFCKKS